MLWDFKQYDFLRVYKQEGFFLFKNAPFLLLKFEISWIVHKVQAGMVCSYHKVSNHSTHH